MRFPSDWFYFVPGLLWLLTKPSRMENSKRRTSQAPRQPRERSRNWRAVVVALWGISFSKTVVSFGNQILHFAVASMYLPVGRQLGTGGMATKGTQPPQQIDYGRRGLRRVLDPTRTRSFCFALKQTGRHILSLKQIMLMSPCAINLHPFSKQQPVSGFAYVRTFTDSSTFAANALRGAFESLPPGSCPSWAWASLH